VELTWMAYLFSYAARFQGTVREVLRFSFMLMAAHPIKAFAVFALSVAGIFLGIVAPGLLTILPAGVCLLVSVITERVFAMHLPQEDPN